MEHLNETLIHDYLDDRVAAAERSRVEAHASSCADCAADLEASRALLADLRALPLGIPPRRDLLPDIHGRLDGASVTPLSGWRHRSLGSMRVPLAAAALVLIAVTFLLTRGFEKQVKSQAVSAPPASTMLVRQELSALEHKYETAIAELQQLVEAQRGQLSPATIDLLQANLRVIDTAIRESRAALEQDPGNEMVNDMLWSAYQKKLEMLRRATAVTST